MNWASVIASTTTVASFVLFVGIVAWAWSARRRAEFAAAANAPFALPDEVTPDALDGETSTERQR
jgi:cytochrome c oxidase cbb3-type subunit 4